MYVFFSMTNWLLDGCNKFQSCVHHQVQMKEELFFYTITMWCTYVYVLAYIQHTCLDNAPTDHHCIYKHKKTSSWTLRRSPFIHQPTQISTVFLLIGFHLTYAVMFSKVRNTLVDVWWVKFSPTPFFDAIGLFHAHMNSCALISWSCCEDSYATR